VRHAARGAVVLLDVPVEGCEALGAHRPRRPVDDVLARVGIPVLPSYTSGDVGPRLRGALLGARPDLGVHETYPYGVLRVLWGLWRESKAIDLDRPSRAELTSGAARWRTWPPRYKRAPVRSERILAMNSVARVIRACGPTYGVLVRRAHAAATWSELARLADEYDAVLGLVAARAARARTPWSWRAEVPGHDGAVVGIAPPWLREAFAAKAGGRRRPHPPSQATVAAAPPRR
jgi:hypothetical protein